MKINNYLSFSLLFAAASLGCFLVLSKPAENSAFVQTAVLHPDLSSAAALTKGDTKRADTLAIASCIQAAEYSISYQQEKKQYESPNREQNLRAAYHADGFELSPRTASSKQWNLKLTLAGITKGGKSLPVISNPGFTSSENKLIVKQPGYTVEYVNSPQGTRQNFIVAARPEGTDDLRVLLSPEGSLELKSVSESEAAFGNNEGIQAAYKDLNVWDAEGHKLPAVMEKKGNMLALRVKDIDAVYPVTVDPLAVTANVTIPGTQSDDSMGYSVASAGDVNKDGFSDVIAGALTFDNGQTDEGAAFVFYGSASGLITSSTGAKAYSRLESNSNNLRFGNSVSAAGDVNKDGYSDVLVGCPQYTNGEAYEGAVFVYYGAALGISLNPAAILQGNKAGARLGTSVSAAGDLNKDSFPDIVSGARDYADGGALQNAEGGVFVYYGSLTGFSAVPVILQIDQGGAYLGGSVSSGDFNKDGFSDLVAGASQYDSGENNEGAAFVFYGSASAVSSGNYVILQSNQSDAYLGTSVASAGDVNKDGYEDMAAGAPYYDDGETNEGGVFVYYGSSTGISDSNKSILQSNVSSAYIGFSVAAAGDFNKDSYPDIVTGAFNYTPEAKGGLWVFNGAAAGMQALASFSQQSASFNTIGYCVAGAGDLNGDGSSDIISGSPNFAGGVYENGAVYVYYGVPAVLPVELLSFSGKKEAGGVRLEWITVSEQNSAAFDVEQSTDGMNFSFVSSVKAKGNTSTQSYYSVFDAYPSSGVSYYRLKQKDLNGSFTFYAPVTVHFDLEAVLSASVYAAENYVSADFNAKAEGPVRFLIYSVNGAAAVDYTAQLKKGNNRVSIPASLTSGMYILKVQGRGAALSAKFVKP